MPNSSIAVRGIQSHAARTPHKIAIIDGDRMSSFAELYQQASQLAAVLRRHGVHPNRPLALMLPNCTEFFVATQASALAGAPYVPVNWHLKRDELAYILEDSGAAVLITDVSLLDHVDRKLLRSQRCTLITVGCDYEEILATTPATTMNPEPAWPVARWMFYTSGTTGRPKGVIHSEFDPDTIALAEDAITELWDIGPDDIFLLAGPAYHAGPGGYAGTTLYAGGTIVVMRSWDAEQALQIIGEKNVTLSFLTPAHFIRLLELPRERWEASDLSSLRLIIHGGAPCPVDVKRRLLELVAPAEVGEVYGGSEGGGTKIMSRDWLSHPGSVGRPWPGAAVRILTDSGAEASTGTEGLIYIRPPGGNRFRYHNDDAKTAAAWQQDAFTLGDIGYVDDEGYLYLTDRASDMVLWNGVNIYPREIEIVLSNHPAVVDCAVVGIPDHRFGEILAAVVELRMQVSDEELRAHCRSALADFKCPQRFERRQRVPRDPNGKVRKKDLRNELLQIARRRQ